ncbi:MAG: hypothetical protein WC937_04370 [Candidatus Omnitrophota bacterium]|jgi:hypothetical protein
MKRLVSLWVFGIGGVVTDAVFVVFFYPLFYILAQSYLFTWIVFLTLVVLLFPVLIVSFVAMLRLKKWGRNIFISMTLIINFFVILFTTAMILTSRTTNFLNIVIILVIFIILFIVYFLKPSTMALFDKEGKLSVK